MQLGTFRDRGGRDTSVTVAAPRHVFSAFRSARCDDRQEGPSVARRAVVVLPQIRGGRRFAPAVLPRRAERGQRAGAVWGDELASRSNIRLIVPDRPGMGGSDPDPGRTLDAWPRDVQALADACGLERFAVLGYSEGIGYAAACAVSLPDRVTRCGFVAPVYHALPELGKAWIRGSCGSGSSSGRSAARPPALGNHAGPAGACRTRICHTAHDEDTTGAGSRHPVASLREESPPSRCCGDRFAKVLAVPAWTWR